MTRTFAALGAMASLLAAFVLSADISSPTFSGREAQPTVEMSGLKMITPQTQAAIDRGLEWLAARQQSDGAFGSGLMYRGNVAVTALSGMAFLSAGNTPGRGKYGKQVEGAVEYILKHTKSNGYIINERYKSHGPMYGHGFATLFLAEVYGMSPDERLREALQKAVKLIVDTQNDDGGWRYDPEPRVADISVTVCQMMALRAARNAGIHVPKSTVDLCVDYVKRCQNVDGGFRYQLVGRPDSVFPRSAAGMVALYNAGLFEGPEINRGLDYLMRSLPRGQFFRYESHYFYGHYYAVQAMWHAGGRYWEEWYPAIRDELLGEQNADGIWISNSVCNEYDTAMALLILQVPNNYLPIFQR
jgi:squalene cyclase